MPELMDAPVCLVLRYFTVGGLERVVSLLANELVARGVSVRVVVLGTSRRNALITELDDAVETHVLDGPWVLRLRRLQSLSKGHVVHLHFGDGKIYPSVRWALRNHPKLVITYHSVYRHIRSRSANRIDRFASCRCSNVVAVSTAVARYCTDEVGLSPGLITVVNNAIPDSPVPVFEHTRGPGLWLIDLAGIQPHKNHVTIVRGLAILRGRGHDVRLRIIGDGPEVADLFRIASDLGVAAQVDWYGAVWRREIVASLLRTSDIFVSASRFEGTPLTALEAMQASLPLVLSDIPAHRETSDGAASFFPADDAEQFAARVEELLDADVRARRGRDALERLSHFSVERFATGYLQVYHSPARTNGRRLDSQQHAERRPFQRSSARVASGQAPRT